MSESLVRQIASRVFIEQYYLKLPFSQPGGCASLISTAGWPMVESILRTPSVDALAVRGAEIWSDGTPDAENAHALIEQGYTLRIRRGEKHDAGLATLSAAFRDAFAAPIDVHIYCTPADQPGLGWHYDAEDVFVLQTHGSKEWSLRKNTVNPWPLPETMPANMRVEREMMPIIKCNLHAGDWLYIPAGYWHSTRAGEESISLAVGVMSTTAMDVYDFLRRELLHSMRWRQRLPIAGSASTVEESELIRQYQEVFAELGRDLSQTLAQEPIVRAFLRFRRSIERPATL